MPKDLIAITCEGTHVQMDGLKTSTIEAYCIKQVFPPNVAKTLLHESNGRIMPIVRRENSPNYSCYNPHTGAYIGTFRIETA